MRLMGTSATWMALGLAPCLAWADPPHAPPVVGGEEVPDGMWEDTAAILFGNTVGCTGVLIAPDLVLTAAHCDYGIGAIEVGTNDSDVRGERVRVERSISYPRSWSSYDLAVLVLRDEVTSVAPRMIAQDCILDDYLMDGAPVTVVGWGAIDEWASEYPGVLMMAETEVTDADCSDLSAGCVPDISPDGELIAGGDGIDSCNGDSGGPLYLNTPEGDFLVGITSRAAEPASRPCGEGGIYVRPDALVEWIEEETGRTLTRPECGEPPPPNEPPAPTAEGIAIDQGTSGQTTIIPNDPDAGDAHAFAITNGPASGRAEIDSSGLLVYTPEASFSGTDAVVVTVTDDGEPNLSASVSVEIAVAEVVEPEPEPEPEPSDDEEPTDAPGVVLERGGCGCMSGPTGGALAPVVLLGLLYRRRRSS